MNSKIKNDTPNEDQPMTAAPALSTNIPSAAKNGPISYFIFRTAKSHRAVTGRLLRSLNLHPGQEVLLMQLWDQDRQLQSKLVADLYLDASTVTKMAQRLEKQGFVTRERSEIDRRDVIIALTPEGVNLKPKIEKIWAELESLTLNGLTAGERSALSSILQKIMKDFDSAIG